MSDAVLWSGLSLGALLDARGGGELAADASVAFRSTRGRSSRATFSLPSKAKTATGMIMSPRHWSKARPPASSMKRMPGALKGLGRC